VKKTKIAPLLHPSTFSRDKKRIKKQHNNQMVELGACGGGRMDRDHVHDP
jgi:hypothetical protein